MTVLALAGFDFMTSIASFSDYFSIGGGLVSGNFSYSGTGGKYGGAAVTILGANKAHSISEDTPYLTRSYDSTNPSSVTVSFYCKLSKTGSPSGYDAILRLSEDSGVWSEFLMFDPATDGLTVKHGYPGSEGNITGITGGTVDLDDGLYHLVEWYQKAGSGTGATTVKVDGTTIVSGTGLTTPDITGYGQYKFYSVNPSFNSNYVDITLDDIIVQSGSNFLSGHRIYNRVPTADVLTEWTPSSGTTHYSLLSNVPYSSGTYVSTTGDSKTELFDIDDVAEAESGVYAVQVSVYGDVSAFRQIAPAIKSGGTVYHGNFSNESVSSNLSAIKLWSVDPATGLDWDETAFNALQMGFVSQSGGGTGQVSIVWDVVLETLAPGFAGSNELPGNAVDPVVIATSRSTGIASEFRYTTIL